MNLLGIYGLFWWSKHIGKFPCSLRMCWVLRTACSLISIFFLYWYNFHCFFIKMSICFFFFLVINEWFLIMSKLKGLSKSQILSFICKQPFWKFYWCAICYSYPPAQCTASISDCSISHASQLANPFLGLPLEFGKCESCGTSEPGKCEGE